MRLILLFSILYCIFSCTEKQTSKTLTKESNVSINTEKSFLDFFPEPKKTDFLFKIDSYKDYLNSKNKVLDSIHALKFNQIVEPFFIQTTGVIPLIKKQLSKHIYFLAFNIDEETQFRTVGTLYDDSLKLMFEDVYLATLWGDAGDSFLQHSHVTFKENEIKIQTINEGCSVNMSLPDSIWLKMDPICESDTLNHNISVLNYVKYGYYFKDYNDNNQQVANRTYFFKDHNIHLLGERANYDYYTELELINNDDLNVIINYDGTTFCSLDFCDDTLYVYHYKFLPTEYNSDIDHWYSKNSKIGVDKIYFDSLDCPNQTYTPLKVNVNIPDSTINAYLNKLEDSSFNKPTNNFEEYISKLEVIALTGNYKAEFILRNINEYLPIYLDGGLKSYYDEAIGELNLRNYD